MSGAFQFRIVRHVPKSTAVRSINFTRFLLALSLHNSPARAAKVFAVSSRSTGYRAKRFFIVARTRTRVPRTRARYEGRAKRPHVTGVPWTISFNTAPPDRRTWLRHPGNGSRESFSTQRPNVNAWYSSLRGVSKYRTGSERPERNKACNPRNRPRKLGVKTENQILQIEKSERGLTERRRTEKEKYFYFN